MFKSQVLPSRLQKAVATAFLHRSGAVFKKNPPHSELFILFSANAVESKTGCRSAFSSEHARETACPLGGWPGRNGAGSGFHAVRLSTLDPRVVMWVQRGLAPGHQHFDFPAH